MLFSLITHCIEQTFCERKADIFKSYFSLFVAVTKLLIEGEEKVNPPKLVHNSQKLYTLPYATEPSILGILSWIYFVHKSNQKQKKLFTGQSLKKKGRKKNKDKIVQYKNELVVQSIEQKNGHLSRWLIQQCGPLKTSVLNEPYNEGYLVSLLHLNSVFDYGTALWHGMVEKEIY